MAVAHVVRFTLTAVTEHPARPRVSAVKISARGEEFRRLSGIYDATVTSVNNAYRALHEQAAGTGSTAA